MPISVKHTKVSAVADGADTSVVRPSDWNADHTLIGVGTAAALDAGVANGVATLDSSATVPISQLPAAVLGAVSYQGTWNASTNTPALASGVGTKGYYYVVSVAGSTNLDGITDWKVGDWAIYNGSAWQKIDNTDAVQSVNGYTGAVVLTYTDVGAQVAGTYVTSVGATAPVASSGGTTPTISMPAATASVNGYLTSTDWTTFNSKQAAGTYVNSVSATAPITSSGGTTPNLAMPAATTSVSGYLTSTDWTTFNSKQPAGTYVTSVGATAPITSSGGATPTLAMPAATSSVNGYLTSTDWTTFNNKGSGSVTSVAASVPSFLSIAGSPITSSGTLAITYSGTALPAANGGTGLTAAGAAGNVLTSNGSAWVSSAPAGSNITAQGLYENAAIISANYTIGTGNNAVSAGPITINSGVVVTVPSGSVWVVV